jgi:hypothetical protein
MDLMEEFMFEFYFELCGSLDRIVQVKECCPSGNQTGRNKSSCLSQNTEPNSV